MRITNIEKFRKELFDNLKFVTACYCTECAESYFERSLENDNLFNCCHLYNCLDVKADTGSFYITVNDEGDVTIWKTEVGKKFFIYVTTVCDWNFTKTQFMMYVAMELQRAILNH